MAFNILVVDDSAVMRAMVIKTLKLSGVPIGEIFQAANGAEGLKVLADRWIDLVLLDINMPVMTGEEMIRKMREQPETSSTAVIVVSTESSDTRVSAIRRLGAEFVHKPFPPELLRETIHRVTGTDHDQHSGDSALQGSGLDF
jgi:two-component system chemotaxis response regulator CheY